jgi:transcriptional regulator with XRE-family HTH domain
MGHHRPRTPRLGEKLRQIRKRLDGGLTQGEFVSRLGLEGDFDQERISKFERGVLEPPLYVLVRVCDIANIPLDILARPEYDIPDELPVRVRRSGGKRAPKATKKRARTGGK